jgi:peptidoglycan/LPS O-acetylase OafA/YrhL
MLAVTAPLALAAEAARVRWLVFSLVALASASFVYLSLFDTHRWLKKALSARFLIYTGTISYGLYLLHKIPFAMLESWTPGRSLLGFGVGLIACYAVAYLSWNLLEKPFLALKRYFVPRKPRLKPASMPPSTAAL